MQGTVSANASRYLPDSDLDSDTLSLQAGASVSFTANLQASFLAGERITNAESLFQTGICIGADPGATFPTCAGGFAVPTGGSIPTEVESVAAVYSATARKVLETGSLDASISRSSSPSSDGELLDSTRLVLSGKHRLTENMTSSLRVDYTETESILGGFFGATIGTEATFRITPGLKWNWSRALALKGEYQYVFNENEESNTGRATRNSLYITMIYRPGQWSVSR